MFSNIGSWFLSQIPGFIAGLVVMAFVYYRNKQKMDKLIQAANKEKQALIDQIKLRAKG